VTISERQRPLLERFMRPGFVMSIKEAQKVDQRPFRSFLVRKYIEYSHTKHGFVLSEVGFQAIQCFFDTSIERKPERWDAPLTAYFDALGVNTEARKRSQRKKERAKRIKRDGSVREFIVHSKAS
jgi:hypothetical protein